MDLAVCETTKRRLTKTILRTVPDKIAGAALARAATAPPLFKSQIFERICSAAVRATRDENKELVVSNLGISATLRCQVPMAKTSYAFGKPVNSSEGSTLALVRELLTDCRHFLDVGANEGLFTFVVADADPERRICKHWFEPDAELYHRLCTNLRRNNVHAHGNHAAVSDKQGSSFFFKNITDDASGSLTDYFVHIHRTTREIVETLRLTDYFNENDIHDAMLKVDVEGAGSKVWSGMAEASSRIFYLTMEMLAPEIENGLPRRIISETGMFGYYIRGYDLIASNEGKFRYVEPFLNWLFCRLDAECLAARLRATPFRVFKYD